MSETQICAQCGYVFPPDQDEPALAGLCPRCLAGGLGKESVEGELPPQTNNAATRIETIRTPLQPGATFKGFEVLEILGQGGMGVVYKARQQSLNRLVALKLLNSQLASSEEFSKRFDREAKVLASLNHPNVVHVHDFGREEGLLYLVLEHVDGSTLEDLMKKKQAANLPKFLSAIRDVARGLQRVHEAGLVHRDVKPSNILLAKDGTAKISDFGLAVESEDAQKLTQSGMFVGTPHYVSPEHAQGKKVDGRSDLYSLGVILFEGFAGRPPFQAPSATALLLKHVNEPPPALYKLAPQSPKAVQEIVRKLLAKNPAARHDTAAALVRDLDRAVEELKNGPPVPATARKSATPPATARKLVAPEGKKLPLKWIAAGGAVALLLLGLLIFAFSGKPEEKPSSLRQSSTVKHGTEAEKPKAPEPAPAPVTEAVVPAPAPAPVPAQADPKPSTTVEDVLRQGDKLLDEARAAFEEGKARGSVESLGEAGFRAESARIKYQAVQEIGGEELKAKATEQLKVIQQLLKLAHEARLAILNAKGEDPAPAPVPGAPVPGVPAPVAPVPGAAMRPAAVVPVAPRRVPLPSAASQKDSEKQIRALFKDDYARKAASDVQAFARKLLEQGAGVGNDDGARYVMLRDARDLAAQVGDLDTAMKAVDSLGQSFEIETVSLKVAAANKAAPQMRGVEGMAMLAKAYLSIMEEGIASGQYDAALTVGPKAEAAARPAKDEILLARVLAVGKDLAFLQRESATARMSAKTLEQKPDDASANLSAGRFACLGAGDWARGLPLLMKGSDAALRTAAEKEFAVADDAASQIAAADAWWAAAEKERTPEYKKRMQSRAARWYLNVLPAASGIAKLQVEARLKQVGGLLLPPSIQGQRTELVGGSGGASYNDQSREAGVLVGLRMSWVDQGLQVLKAVQPLFNSGSSLQEGPVRGKTPSAFKEVLAKPGYAVGGLVARGTNRVNGMKIIFMRISGIALDPRDSYESEWFGDKGNGEVRLGGDGTYVLGICGGAFEDVDSLGLLMLRRPTSGATVLPAPAAPVSIGAGTPAPKGTIDLLALVDVSADAVAGEWKVEDGVLVSLPGDHARLQLPIVPPDEYDLKIVMERRDGADGVALGLAQGSAQWAFIVDKLPAEGYRSGFEALDGQNLPGPSAVTGPRLTTGQPATFDVKVRKSSVTVALNGQSLINWQGNTNRFTNHPRWQMPNPKALWLGQWWSRVHFSQITLTTVSGQGRLLRGGAGAATAKGAIDLLPLIDPKQDSVRGVWKAVGGKISSPEPMEEVDELLQVPYVPPEEYDLTMVVERVSGTDGFGIGLSAGSSTFMMVADSDFGRGTGLSLVDLKTANENETTWNGTLFKSSRPVTLQISVRRNSFSVTADGQPIIKWVPNYARCTLRERWATPNRGALSLCGLRGVYQVSRLSVVPISGPGMFLRKSAAPAPEGSGGPLPKGTTDLLALVDPAADAVAGEWILESAQLVSTAGQHVRLQLPVIPPDEYDLKVVVERQEGVDGIAFGLAHGASQWTVYVDKFPQEGSQTGIEMVDNGMATSVKGPQLVNGQPATFEFKVRKAGFTVLKDGKSLISWQGNYSRLSNFSRWEVRNNRALFLGQWSNRLRYSEIRLTAVSGEGRLIRGGAATAAPVVPKNAVDLLSFVDPKLDAVNGIFSKDATGLSTPNGVPWARIMVPYAPPAEYDLTLVVERKEGVNSFNFGPIWNGKLCHLVIEGKGPGIEDVAGLDLINGRPFFDNETTTRGPFLIQGKPSTVVVSVRKTSLTMTIDGRAVFSWKGDPSRISGDSGIKVPNREAMVIGCYDSQFLVSRIFLTPVSGLGRKLR